MRDGRARVCIATDVAARGIDLPGLELVIHADLPTNSETLLHRSGRTGRAGNKGISAFIVPVNQRRKAERLLMGASVTPAWVLPPSAEEVIARDQERLLADPVFSEELREEEQDLVARLVEAYGAEKLATAFVNLHRNNNAAPEDLIEISIDGPRKPRERASDRFDARGEAGESFPSTPRTPRGDFGPAIWLSLSVGRKQNAEPRWLIPMLCRNGNITKSGIGAIKMQQMETYVELSADVADTFLGAIGPNRMLERGVRVTVLDGVPDLSRQSEPRSFEKRSFEDRPPRREFNDAPREGGAKSATAMTGARASRRQSRPMPVARRATRKASTSRSATSHRVTDPSGTSRSAKSRPASARRVSAPMANGPMPTSPQATVRSRTSPSRRTASPPSRMAPSLPASRQNPPLARVSRKRRTARTAGANGLSRTGGPQWRFARKTCSSPPPDALSPRKGRGRGVSA